MADDVQSILADDNFKSLAIGEKDKVLAQVDPNYAGLPPRERAHALGVIHYGKDAVADPQSSPVLRSIYGVGRGMNDVVEGIYQTFIHPINTVNAMASQTEEHLKKAKGETSTVGKLAEYGAAVPALGPFGQQLGERAGRGDVAGAVSEGLTASVFPEVAKEGAKALPLSSVRRMTLEAPEKISLPGGFKINRNVPPSEGEVMEQKAQDVTKRQAEQDKIDRAAAKVTAKRTIEPATEKTISGPAPARTLRNPPWKVTPVKGGSGATSSSVIDSLPSKYGVSQAGVDAFKQGEASAAARAASAVPIAPAAPTEATPATITPPWKSRAARNAAQPQPTTITPPPAAEAPSTTGKTPYREPTAPSSGIRPSMTEQYATFLAKKPIWSPAEEQFARRIWGEDANIRSGEGQSKYRARLLGMVRSGRAAVGMQDVESGPMQPPPEP